MSSTHVNHLNSALIVASLVAAFYLPFELFLLSYAILGPLHYLTEMSWLHDRNYFVANRWLALPIAALSLVSLMASNYFPAIYVEGLGSWNAEAVIGALGLGLVFLTAKTNRGRWLGAAGVILFCLGAHVINGQVRDFIGVKAADGNAYTAYDVFATIMLTTLIHVFVFTAAFLLFGALKSRSGSGMFSFLVLLVCSALCFAIPAEVVNGIDGYVAEAYRETSQVVNAYMMIYTRGEEPLTALGRTYNEVLQSPLGVKMARFIAFAYTYHYLNWFSKTSVIKWHEVPILRLVFVVGIWLVSLWLYYRDYSLGLRWLLLLSMMHVFLEFPLNWVSFFGIGKELKARVFST